MTVLKPTLKRNFRDTVALKSQEDFKEKERVFGAMPMLVHVMNVGHFSLQWDCDTPDEVKV